MSDEIRVDCQPAGAGWSCSVRVGSDPGATSHEVSVSRSELESLAPGAEDPTPLVEASFQFLLEREPRESILHRFELSVIERYFPEYQSVIRRKI